LMNASKRWFTSNTSCGKASRPRPPVSDI
jgi:hypothetical protein